MLFLIRFFLIVLAISETFTIPQFDNIEVYEINLTRNQENQYQNNPFLNILTGNINNRQQNHQGNYQDNIHPSSTCDSFWSYENDHYEKWGLITIPDPSYQKSFIRIQLSLAARLSTVCS